MTEAERIARAYRELESTAGSRYDLRNRGNQAMLAERRRLARRLLDAAGFIPMRERRALEVGSGTGAELAWLLEVGAQPGQLAGVDLLPARVATARQAFPNIQFEVANAEHLDFPDSSFDLVLTFTVFSSILDASMAANVAAEIDRVMRPAGALLWYDFRYDSPSNRNVRGVTAQHVRDLFPRLQGKMHAVTLLPPLSRRLGALAPVVYPAMATVPPLRTHLLGLLRKPA